MNIINNGHNGQVEWYHRAGDEKLIFTENSRGQIIKIL